MYASRRVGPAGNRIEHGRTYRLISADQGPAMDRRVACLQSVVPKRQATIAGGFSRRARLWRFRPGGTREESAENYRAPLRGEASTRGCRRLKPPATLARPRWGGAAHAISSPCGPYGEHRSQGSIALTPASPRGRG